MPRILLLLPLLLWSTACAIPHGSFARPVDTPIEGSNMITGGVMVPVTAAVGVGNDSSAGSLVQEGFVIPAVAYDHAFGERTSFGVELSLVSTYTSFNDSTTDIYGFYLNPRGEFGVSENFSFTVDGNIALLGVVDDDDGDRFNLPFFQPTFGIRWYLPTGFGGFILSQQLGTGFVTLYAPGSVAYDIPIPLGNVGQLHLFPEFRWDPTVGIGSIWAVSGSAGLSFMVELY